MSYLLNKPKKQKIAGCRFLQLQSPSVNSNAANSSDWFGLQKPNADLRIEPA
jgi:hypothetical protein